MTIDVYSAKDTNVTYAEDTAWGTAGTPTGTIEVRVEQGNIHSHRTMSGGAGDEGSASLSGIIDVNANDELEFWLHNETNTADPTVQDITLSIFQIGG